MMQRGTPKYPEKKDTIGLHAAPDIFLFPRRIPTLEDPEPPVHSLETLKLPDKILDLFDVDQKSRNEHIWEVHVGLEEIANGRIQRKVMVMHVDEVVDESKSRAWVP